MIILLWKVRLFCYNLFIFGEFSPFFRDEFGDGGDALLGVFLNEIFFSVFEVQDISGWWFLWHFWILDITVFRHSSSVHDFFLLWSLF